MTAWYGQEVDIKAIIIIYLSRHYFNQTFLKAILFQNAILKSPKKIIKNI